MWLILKLLPLLLILWLIYKIYLQPYLICKFYAKQGATVLFLPGKSTTSYHRKNAEKHGDYFYWYDEAIKKNPNLKMAVRNEFHMIMVFLLSPDTIRDFAMNEDKYRKSKLMDLYLTIGGEGVFFLYGNKWKKHRKITTQVMHFEFYQDMILIILDTAKSKFDSLIKNDKLKDVSMRPFFESITAELVGKIFFGDSISEAGMINGTTVMLELASLILELGYETYKAWNVLLGSWFIKAGILPRHKRLMNRIQNFTEFCQKLVEKRRQEYNNAIKHSIELSKKKDLLQLLFEAQEKDPENTMTNSEIVGEFTNFFVAGMDTTGELLTMATYHLANHPEYLSDARKEAEELLLNVSTLTTQQVLQETFLSYILKETLRFTPPAAGIAPRVAHQDHKLGSMIIKKGSLIGIGIKTIGMNPKYYDNPERFQPLRWSEKREFEGYSFLPFSTGPRNCIGQHLAQIEAKLILSLFLKTFDCQIAKDYIHKMTVAFLYGPMHPLRMNLAVRNI
jgi:cytochrome P450 family 4 subfamily V